MISDVLSEAIAKIEHYQADPGSASLYAEPRLQAQIEDVERHAESKGCAGCATGGHRGSAAVRCSRVRWG